MATTNNKNIKSGSATSKAANTKKSKSSAGLVNSMPPVPKARDRAKAIDSGRRGDSDAAGLNNL